MHYLDFPCDTLVSGASEGCVMHASDEASPHVTHLSALANTCIHFRFRVSRSALPRATGEGLHAHRAKFQLDQKGRNFHFLLRVSIEGSSLVIDASITCHPSLLRNSLRLDSRNQVRLFPIIFAIERSISIENFSFL